MAYFGTLPIEEIVPALKERWTSYQDWAERSGYKSRIMACYDQHYTLQKAAGHRLNLSQEKNLHSICVNHYRNINNNIVQLVTQNKTSYFVKARDGDSNATSTAIVGKGAIDNYVRTLRLNKTNRMAVLTALVCQEAFFYVPWDRGAGRRIAIGDSFVSSGDSVVEVLTPLHVARNPRAKTQKWYIVATRKNKYDLASQFAADRPDFAEYIEGLSDKEDDFNFLNRLNFGASESGCFDDEIWQFTFLHEASDVLPRGRIVTYVGNQAIEEENDLIKRYERIPVFRVSGGDVIESITAHSPAIDTLSLQEALDKIYTAIVTNAINLSTIQLYSSDPKTAVNPIKPGTNLWTGAQAPQALDLHNASPSVLNVINQLQGQQTQLSGLNDVVRGTVQNAPNLKSGTALALVLTSAIQYVSELQEEISFAQEGVGNQLIVNLKLNATESHVALLGGPGAETYTKDFTKQEISGVERVTVELQNSVMATQAGRMQVGETMLNQDAGNFDDYLALVTTGETPPSAQRATKIRRQVQAENEALRRGEQVPVLASDKHENHYPEHLDILSEPETRKNPVIVANILEHCKWHFDNWLAMNPAEAMLLGHMPPPGQGNVPPPASGDMGEGEPMDAAEAMEISDPTMPRLPNMPEGTPAAYQNAMDSYKSDLALEGALQ